MPGNGVRGPWPGGLPSGHGLCPISVVTSRPRSRIRPGTSGGLPAGGARVCRYFTAVPAGHAPGAACATTKASAAWEARKLERPSAELGPHGMQTALQKALFDFAGRQGHRGVKFSGRLARVAKPAQVIRQGGVP
jgi:hypothetical protein